MNNDLFNIFFFILFRLCIVNEETNHIYIYNGDPDQARIDSLMLHTIDVKCIIKLQQSYPLCKLKDDSKEHTTARLNDGNEMFVEENVQQKW